MPSLCLVSDIDLNDLNGAPVLSGAQQSRRKAVERFERLESAASEPLN